MTPNCALERTAGSVRRGRSPRPLSVQPPLRTTYAHAETARGVLAESRHPIIDSHTRPAARGTSPRFRSDDELRAVASRGGVVGMQPSARGKTFDDFLEQAVRNSNDCRSREIIGATGSNLLGSGR